ncbi:alpha/beta hydrolase [Niveispirillum cyanobacteriorum]|uniref:alpha/beta hydrolase n=1 Tax=Niveispirillum cyanobacteriorum TaxID=1612173 RepID=UPI0018F81A0D|nr:hypothetical protein [Niveispirillum cyanobacteriorum]GGE77040.1 hypothetical protein GCM10011317_37630 [Niveispirillum cyanobacteriorum]
MRILVPTPLGKRLAFVEREPYGSKDARIRAAIVRAMHAGDSATAGLLSTPAHAIREMWCFKADLKPRWPSVRQPTLLVQSREDDIASLSNAFYLLRRLGGRVDMLVLDDSYHLVTVDRQRDLMATRVTDFLTTLVRERPAILVPARVANGD